MAAGTDDQSEDKTSDQVPVGDTVPVRETVPAALAGERVDRVVALITGLPRREVTSLVDAGAVRVGGRPVKDRSRRLRAGEAVEVLAPAQRQAEGLVADPSVIFGVVFEDDSVIVIDKPPGLVVHPGAGNAHGTLVHGLLARFPDLGDLAPSAGDEDGPDAARPGIVHRLDRGTSGLLVVARTEAARRSLVGQLAARHVERHYRALCSGTVEADEGLVDAPLGRSGRDPTRMTVRVDGREARTRYHVLERFTAPYPATLLESRLETGRTHQIRVHLAAIGHPVVGDPRYGRTSGPHPGPSDINERPFLHAHTLAFDHPVSGDRLRFCSSLPADLRDVLAQFS